MLNPTPSQRPIQVFISFSPEDAELLSRLERSLAVLVQQRVISICHSEKIEAGKDVLGEIQRFVDTAHVILLLVSSDFLASDRCYSDELVRAMERYKAGQVQVIPVIVRPCDWEDTPFGRLPSLPDDARPITTWNIQDEAFRNIAKRLRSLILEGTQLSDSRPRKREIPPLLPHLCNRVEQDEELAVLLSSGDALRHRPLICVVHGNEDECHDMYKSRLQHVSFPRLLRGDFAEQSTIHDIFLPFPRTSDTVQDALDKLRRALAEKVTNNKEASDDEVAETLAQFRTPIVIHSYLRAESWGMYSPDLVDALIKYWGRFPDLPSSMRLIICLFIIYTEVAAEGTEANTAMALERGSDVNFPLRSYLNGIDFTNIVGVSGAILPEISAVRLDDAEDYFRDDTCFSELCKTHPAFCNVQGAVEEIRMYYKRDDRKPRVSRVPMQELSKELKRILEKYLC